MLAVSDITKKYRALKLENRRLRKALRSLSTEELECGLHHEEACCIREACIQETADEALAKPARKGTES